ncbi:MAG: carboxymuconolactone decarboxylase family protein [Prevotella sp.]|jgi:alkylhydroperoxidase/carboxymuconolactone decarboxylase family protein YurZ/quercetin dioxygenase-like cupin family protein
MKKNRLLWLATILMGMMLYSGNLYSQTNMTLTTKQQSLSTIATFEAAGDMAQLHKAINNGLDNGLTVAQIKEALVQLYAYTGFPRSLNALGQLQQVIAEREKQGKQTAMGEDDKQPIPDGFNSLKVGTDVQTKVSGRPFNYNFAPREDYFLKAHLFGDIFVSPVLTQPERELVTVSAIASLPGCEPQLRSHCNGALNMGLSKEELSDIPTVLEQAGAHAAAARAAEAVASVLGTKVNEKLVVRKGIEDSPWPIGDLNTGYAKYFIGNSYLAPLGGGLVNVTFEPGCRNNWHIHHNGVQVLVCVAGTGWYQEWGKPAVKLTPGMVIAIPEGAKHWHGAAADSWFQHLTYMTDVKPNSSNEWLEPVDDDTYNKL